jgi:hypothetical protein
MISIIVFSAEIQFLRTLYIIHGLGRHRFDQGKCIVRETHKDT